MVYVQETPEPNISGITADGHIHAANSAILLAINGVITCWTCWIKRIQVLHFGLVELSLCCSSGSGVQYGSGGSLSDPFPAYRLLSYRELAVYLEPRNFRHWRSQIEPHRSVVHHLNDNITGSQSCVLCRS